MKHVKTYENKAEEERLKKEQENIDILDDLLKTNPLHKDNDFYIFIASDKFIETKNGLYKKYLDIEKMVRITPDSESLGAMQGLQMRARFQSDSKLYHIWLPIEFRDQIENKGTNSMDDYMIDLINKYKKYGSDDQGRKAVKDVKQRIEDIKKYNI